jgi:hypothetical protein
MPHARGKWSTNMSIQCGGDTYLDIFKFNETKAFPGNYHYVRNLPAGPKNMLELLL